MFIGHFGVGFASKRLAPRLNLGVLLVAPLLLDMLWPIFLVVGVESVKIDPGIASMAAILALIYAANFNGPPPPSVNAIIVVSFVLWLFIPWAFWADRHRVPVGEGG